MSTTQTTRERFERAAKQMQDFADELDAKGDTPSEDELAKLTEMGNEVVAAKSAFETLVTADGTINMAKSFTEHLSGTATATSPGDVVIDGASGIVDPRGMTLGEAFTKSPAYQEFLDKYKGSDGKIRDNVVANSDAFAVKGFDSKALVTGASDTSGGAFVTPTRLGGVTDLIGERRLTVRDLCTNITINSDTFEYVTVTAKTNNAAAVAEATTADDPASYGDPASGAKPSSSLTTAVVSSPVETIAHIIEVSRRAAADAPQVRQLVDAFLLYGLKEEEEDQILNGNGTSPNLRGILQTVGISTTGSAGTDLDAIVDAIRTIRADRREPNAMVIHPNDWFSTGFLLAKDSAGNYLVGNPRASLDQLNSLWGLRVVVTPAMTENTALVGDFRQAVVADRQQSTLYVTDSHKDHFSRNILDILAEERLAFGVLDPDAFCTVTAI